MSLKSLDLISEAFFASKVLDILTKSKIEEDDVAVLEEALKRISEIKEGKKLVSFEQTDNQSISPISSDSIALITAYGRAIEIISYLEVKLGQVDDKPEQCIEKFLSDIEREITKVLGNHIIEENDLKYTRAFFREIRRKVLTESDNAFMTTRKVVPWLETPIY